ncbi:MAG: hypothetical protein CFH10_00196 [Alphaproteobacteria bacterium MarineAlpha4_Bin2]|nr:MAG: hypothetical protein CFH10_00196 [Alphaproteobacteria bacterium MarineAlpha4_Bin2]
MTNRLQHPPNYSVFVRNLQLPPHPGATLKALSLSVELKVEAPSDLHADRYKYVVCYDRVVKGAKLLIESGDIASLQELGESVAGLCLEDTRVHGARVAIIPVSEYQTGMDGIEVYRDRQ